MTDHYSTWTDAEFINEFAKCGINHNHSHNEEKLESYLNRLEKAITRITELESLLEAERESNRELLYTLKSIAHNCSLDDDGDISDLINTIEYSQKEAKEAISKHEGKK